MIPGPNNMKIEKILKNNNKRITSERVAIFDYLKTKHIFSYDDITKNFDDIWRSSIFRTLNLFLDIWVIRKIDIWDNKNTYELEKSEHHHEHMKCNNCDKIISFHSDKICNQLFEEAKKIWFEIKQHNIWIVWICKKCN